MSVRILVADDHPALAADAASERLGATTRTQAVATAFRMGLIA